MKSKTLKEIKSAKSRRKVYSNSGKKFRQAKVQKSTLDKVEVFCGEEEYYITKAHYDRNQLARLDLVKKCCETCKNDVEFPPAHTCDICKSLDQEYDYEMWGHQD